MNGISALLRDPREFRHPFHHVRAPGDEGGLQTRPATLTGTQPV